MKLHIQFVEAVQKSDQVPDLVRIHVAETTGVKERVVQADYLQFLEQQIALEPRGPEWTEVLRKRRDVLIPFLGRRLLSGHILIGNDTYFIDVCPETNRVVRCEP
jgi:hypothetical protein